MNFSFLLLFFFFLALAVEQVASYASIGPLASAVYERVRRSAPPPQVVTVEVQHQPQTARPSRLGEGDQDTLFLIHTTLQKEVDTLLRVSARITNNNDDDATHLLLQDLIHFHVKSMTQHMESTQTYLLPKFVKAARLTAVEEHMQASYQDLRQRLAQIVGKGGSATLKNNLQAYQERLQRHFAWEESVIVRPSRAAMSNLQWAWTIQRFMEKGGVDMGSFIHHMGGEDVFRQQWMAACRLPSILWNLHFAAGLANFRAHWADRVDRVLLVAAAA